MTRTAKKNDESGFPRSGGEWLLALIPEIAVFIFIAVMVIALIRHGGQYAYALWLMPILVTNIYAIRKFAQRVRCS